MHREKNENVYEGALISGQLCKRRLVDTYHVRYWDHTEELGVLRSTESKTGHATWREVQKEGTVLCMCARFT